MEATGHPEDVFGMGFDIALIGVWLPAPQKLDVAAWDSNLPSPGGRTRRMEDQSSVGAHPLVGIAPAA